MLGLALERSTSDYEASQKAALLYPNEKMNDGSVNI